MGLQEKVWVKKWQDEAIPAHQKNFKERCGGDLTIEVAWDSVLADPNASQNFEGMALNPFRDALYTVCRTEVGRDAVKAGLKKLTWRHSPDPAQRSLTMKDGVLALVGDLRTSVKPELRINDHAIKKAIEDAL